jgi:hypothetical protein
LARLYQPPAFLPFSMAKPRPEGDQWLHEIKFDGYRMQARLDRGAVRSASWENTGNFIDFWLSRPNPAAKSTSDQALMGQFPVRENREFFEA